jgi:hypothetical protein
MEGLHRLTHGGAGMDLFTLEILNWQGLITYCVLFVIELETRRVILAGVTRHPYRSMDGTSWRNLTNSESGTLGHQKYILHDPDTKFCSGFRSTLSAGGCSRSNFPPARPI